MRKLRLLARFVLLFGFWLLLSARLDPHLVLSGAISAAVVTLVSAPLFDRPLGAVEGHPRLRLWRWVPFAGWQLGRMAASAAHVARVVLDPRRRPDPGLVRFRTELSTPAARAVLANAITLTPGTVTVDVVGNELTIHSITPDAVQDIARAAVQNRVAAIFGDLPQAPPTLWWDLGHTLGGQVVGAEGPPSPEGPFAPEGGS